VIECRGRIAPEKRRHPRAGLDGSLRNEVAGNIGKAPPPPLDVIELHTGDVTTVTEVPPTVMLLAQPIGKDSR
jgi:hypothetical protein